MSRRVFESFQLSGLRTGSESNLQEQAGVLEALECLDITYLCLSNALMSSRDNRRFFFG